MPGELCCFCMRRGSEIKLIGISGASCSGKTSLTTQLAKEEGCAGVFYLDKYYKVRLSKTVGSQPFTEF